MRALVIANVETLPEPIDAWKPLIANLDTSQSLLPIVEQSSLLSSSGKNLGVDGAVVVPIPAIDSSFCVTSAKGPTSYDDPRLPALSVAISFLEVAESPLWVAVRGAGLAYSASFSKDLDSGVVHLDIYRSPDAYRAFAASKKVIENYIDGTLEFDGAALEGAISNIVVGLADEQNTMAATGRMSFVNTAIRGLKPDYSTQILKKVRAVTVDELKAVMRDVLLPAMQPGTASVVVTCGPGLVEGITKGFTESGFKTQTRELSSFYDDYGLQADEDDEDEDEVEGSEDGSDEGEEGEGSDDDEMED